MALSEIATVTVPRRGSAPGDRDAGCTVVWLRGEHDIATTAAVMAAIADAAQRDDADLLVDLSEVTFMDASTVGALVGSCDELRARSRSLMLRAPSPRARRILDLCGVAHLVQHPGADTVHPAGAAAALSTWVDVPAARSMPGVIDAPVPAERREAARPRLTAEARRSRTSSTIAAGRGRR